MPFTIIFIAITRFFFQNQTFCSLVTQVFNCDQEFYFVTIFKRTFAQQLFCYYYAFCSNFNFFFYFKRILFRIAFIYNSSCICNFTICYICSIESFDAVQNCFAVFVQSASCSAYYLTTIRHVCVICCIYSAIDPCNDAIFHNSKCCIRIAFNSDFVRNCKIAHFFQFFGRHYDFAIFRIQQACNEAQIQFACFFGGQCFFSSTCQFIFIRFCQRQRSPDCIYIGIFCSNVLHLTRFQDRFRIISFCCRIRTPANKFHIFRCIKHAFSQFCEITIEVIIYFNYIAICILIIGMIGQCRGNCINFCPLCIQCCAFFDCKCYTGFIRCTFAVSTCIPTYEIVTARCFKAIFFYYNIVTLRICFGHHCAATTIFIVCQHYIRIFPLCIQSCIFCYSNRISIFKLITICIFPTCKYIAISTFKLVCVQVFFNTIFYSLIFHLASYQHFPDFIRRISTRVIAKCDLQLNGFPLCNQCYIFIRHCECSIFLINIIFIFPTYKCVTCSCQIAFTQYCYCVIFDIYVGIYRFCARCFTITIVCYCIFFFLNIRDTIFICVITPYCIYSFISIIDCYFCNNLAFGQFVILSIDFVTFCCRPANEYYWYSFSIHCYCCMCRNRLSIQCVCTIFYTFICRSSTFITAVFVITQCKQCLSPCTCQNYILIRHCKCASFFAYNVICCPARECPTKCCRNCRYCYWRTFYIAYRCRQCRCCTCRCIICILIAYSKCICAGISIYQCPNTNQFNIAADCLFACNNIITQFPAGEFVIRCYVVIFIVNRNLCIFCICVVYSIFVACNIYTSIFRLCNACRNITKPCICYCIFCFQYVSCAIVICIIAPCCIYSYISIRNCYCRNCCRTCCIFFRINLRIRCCCPTNKYYRNRFSIYCYCCMCRSRCCSQCVCTTFYCLVCRTTCTTIFVVNDVVFRYNLFCAQSYCCSISFCFQCIRDIVVNINYVIGFTINFYCRANSRNYCCKRFLMCNVCPFMFSKRIYIAAIQLIFHIQSSHFDLRLWNREVNRMRPIIISIIQLCCTIQVNYLRACCQVTFVIRCYCILQCNLIG